MPNKIFYPLAIGLVAWMVGYSIYNLGGSLDWDELDVTSKLANGEYLLTLTPAEEKTYGIRIPDVVDPRKNVRNHFIATASALGISSMFGNTKQAFRSPSVLWTLLLGILLICSKQLLGRPLVLLLLAHLSVNGLCLWYFHSMRGYASVILLSTALFILALQWMDGPWWKIQAYSFFALGFVAPLTHAFGGIYFALLVGAMVLSQRARWRELLPAALPLLFMLYLFVSQFLFISRVGYLMTKNAPGISEPLLAVFGTRQPYMMAAMALTMVGLAYVQIFKRRAPLALPFVIVAVLWTFILFALFVLRTSFFEPRFILPFLVPSVAWMGMRLLDSKKGIALALVLLVIFPLLQQPASIAAVQNQMQAFDSFSEKAKVFVRPESCFFFSGETDQVYFSRSLFIKDHPPCRNYYHVHYGRNWNGEIPLEQEAGFIYELKLDDGEGRKLFELQPRQHIAASR